MTRLNQIIAAEGGSKKRAEQQITETYQYLQKDDLFAGLTRVYSPVADDGERLPSETKIVQRTADEAYSTMSESWVDLFDLTLTKDAANMAATADIIVDGSILVEAVPVTTLLFLEKRLVDVRTVISETPTLDPAFVWTESDSGEGQYQAESTETARTKKIPKNHVKSEATDKHPAQVETYHEDVVVGTWSAQKFSGAIPARTRTELMSRVTKLINAVKFAREEANSNEIVEQQMGEALMNYVF